MTNVKIDMEEVAGTAILSGAVTGRAAFAEIIRRTTKEPDEPIPLLLDFSKIEVATASYLRESVFALKNYMRTTNSKFYPVVANVNNVVREEAAVVAEARGDVIVAVVLRKGVVVAQTLIGSLDPKQSSTLQHVTALKSTDAGSLMNRFGEGEKTASTTAWNNRLAALVSRGLIREYSRGRAKFYRPLFEEIH